MEMQRGSLRCRFIAAIEAVAEQGAAQTAGRVDTDLMGAAGAGAKLNPAQASGVAFQLIVGD